MYACRQRYFAFLCVRPYGINMYFEIPCSTREAFRHKRLKSIDMWSKEPPNSFRMVKQREIDVLTRKIYRPTRRRRTLLPRSFPAFQKMSRVSPRLSTCRRMFLVVIERFEGDQFGQYQNWQSIKMARRPRE